ncbi:MAG: hypothetical protein Q7S40_27940 [Opitutaceae bacterium]|nr:hypothetical protein [Opitutaceae bacterium]
MNLRLPSTFGVFVAAMATAASGAADDYHDELAVPFPVVFFPPVPPVYGSSIAERAADTPVRYGGRRLTPPDGLADFAGDIIYPQFSTRLHSGALSRATESRIEAYRSRRNELVHALLDRLITLHDAADDARERELRAFAEVQTPSIGALESEADALRRELARNRLGLDIGWNASRRWKLDSFPASREWLNLEAEFQVVRAAAFYEDGLTPGQRGLLRELAFELDRSARKARGEPADRRDSEAMFFSPEMTRLRLPPDLPPEVLARIATYNAEKAKLKVELREMIHRQENASRAERAAAFTRLAEDQWPHLSNLETLAEELRTDLGPRFVPLPPEKPPAIPTWLMDVIHGYNEDRDSYFGELRYAIYNAVELIPRPTRREREKSDEYLREQDEYAAKRKEAERAAVLEFQECHAERFALLHKRYLAIREALEAIARTTSDPKTGRPLNVDALLRYHTAAMAEFDAFGRATAIYTNYRTAMMQRGLSPEQRRLLFGYAVAALAQPLPYGEPVPRRSTKYPLPR